MGWSADQLRALDLTHHIALVANAGSGKTSVLTERFAKIVSQGIAPLEHVVAITFTKKAAAEMRSRVHHALASSTSAAAREAYRRIAQARISTFHSFCGTLLRQYPNESGVNVDAREVSPRETEILRATAMREGMSAALGVSSDIREDLLVAFDELGVATVETTVRSMMKSRETLEQRTAWWYSRLFDDHLSYRLTVGRDYVYDTVSDVCAEIVDGLAAISGLDGSLHAEALTILHDLKARNSNRNPLARCVALYDRLYTSTGTAKKQKAEDPLLKQLPPIGISFRELTQLCREPDTDTEALGLRVSGAMIRAAEFCAERYAALRTEANVIDFDDMLIGVRDLLRNCPHVAHEVRQSIRFLMVDEFQDTNPLQYEIVRLLAPNLDPNASTVPDEEHPNVFIVGDPKQSIYGFRAADVRLFRQAQTDIARANNERGAPHNGIVTLRASYRMHANLAGFVDHWCGSMFVQESEFDVAYEPLVAGRNTPENFDGSVQLLCTNVTASNDDDDDADALAVECRHIAMRLCEMLQPDSGCMVCTRDGLLRPASAGDVAILVRSLDGVEAVATALRDVGIPYQTHGGRAFYQRQEVDDIRNLLRFCTDTSDDVALAATLRSPFLRCSHESLMFVGAMRPHNASLWDGLCAAVAVPDPPEDLVMAHACLREAIADVQTMPLSMAVRRMMERGPWHEYVGASPRRDQIVANAEKVLSILRDELQHGNTFRDAVEALTPPDDEGDADATFEADPHSVQVMTMHAAKGLQFPIVVVAQLEKRSPGVGSVGWTDSHGMTINLAPTVIPASNPTVVIERPASVAHIISTQGAAHAARAEERRLLYVALTRAQDHLVISQTFKVLKDGGLNKPTSLAKHLRPLLFETPPDDVRSIPTSITLRRFHGDEVHETLVVRPFVLHHADRHTDISDLTFAGNQQEQHVVDLSTSLLHMAMPDMMSVTELLDPSLLTDEPSARTVTDDVTEASGTAYGTVVHYLLQHALTSDLDCTTATASNELLQLIANRSMDARVAQSAVTETLAVLRSAELDTVRHHWTDVSFETARTAAHSNTVLYGVMDVVAYRADGAIHVIDWKTNRLSDDRPVAALSEAYAPQMEAYAWLLLNAHPTAPSVTCTLFYTHPLLSGKGALLHAREFARANMDALRARLDERIAGTLTRRLARLRV
jgi:ATP-dependent helicase/nuclease subunit A